MRVGGLASGIDTDQIIRELMNAERIPLTKLEQQKTRLEWQRDAYREINRQIAELERLITDMRLTSNTINPKTASSSMESAATATASSSAPNGVYRIAVTQLATNAINVGQNVKSRDEINDYISQFVENNPSEESRTMIFYTYGEADPENNVEAGMQARKFVIEEGDTIDSIVRKINEADENIRAYYDEVSGRLIMEMKRTGKYNHDENSYGGKEIGFDENANAIFEFFGMDSDEEVGGTDAKFIYNGVEFTSKENRYTLNGVTFTFNDVTGSDPSNPVNATLTVTNDVDAAVENIKEFVNKYNELVETINSALNEPVYRDYPPLTDEQMEEMTERQIELWEERAKSGLLRRDPILSSALTSFRSTWSTVVDNDSAFRMLAEIGITTTKDYMDGGKLEIDEELLRQKLEEDAASVQNLLFNNSEGASRGLLNRLEDSLENTISRIEERAGKGSFTSQMYTMGRQLEAMEERIEAFEERLKQVEDRYWRQFTAMERAISMMNTQSAMLMSFSANLYQ